MGHTFFAEPSCFGRPVARKSLLLSSRNSARLKGELDSKNGDSKQEMTNIQRQIQRLNQLIFQPKALFIASVQDLAIRAEC